MHARPVLSRAWDCRGVHGASSSHGGMPQHPPPAAALRSHCPRARHRSRRTGSRGSSYSLHAVGECLRLAFNGTAALPTPEEKLLAGGGGANLAPGARAALAHVTALSASAGLPPHHTAYKTHVHMQKNKARGSSAGAVLGCCCWATPVLRTAPQPLCIPYPCPLPLS